MTPERTNHLPSTRVDKTTYPRNTSGIQQRRPNWSQKTQIDWDNHQTAWNILRTRPRQWRPAPPDGSTKHVSTHVQLFQTHKSTTLSRRNSSCTSVFRGKRLVWPSILLVTLTRAGGQTPLDSDARCSNPLRRDPAQLLVSVFPPRNSSSGPCNDELRGLLTEITKA